MIHPEFERDSLNLLTALKTVYPLMISVNLTKNSFYMIEYDQYLNKRADYDGVFDDLIADGAATMHPDHRQQFIDTFCRESQLRAFAAGEKEISMDCLQSDEQGVYHWVHTQVIRAENRENDDVLQFTLARPNVLVKQLEARNQQLELVMSAIPGGMVIHRNDERLSFDYVSEEAAALFGYTVDEFLEYSSGCAVGACIQQDVEEAFAQREASIKAGKQHYTTYYRIRCKDGSLKRVAEHGTLFAAEHGSELCHAFLLDITKEHDAQQKLQEQKEEILQMETINILTMDYLHVFRCNLDAGRTTLLSTTDKEALRALFAEDKNLLGYRDMLEKYVPVVVAEEDREMVVERLTEENVRRELTENQYIDVYFRSIYTGTSKYMQVRLARLNSDNESFQILVGFRDVDEQMRKEQEHRQNLADALAQAEYANKAKTKFLNSMSHDIRTPMNAIMGYTALAATRLDDKEQVADYLTKVSRASSHLLSLINDVLDMSRIESGKMQVDESEASLADIIHDLRSMIQTEIQAKQLEFHVDTVDVTEEHIFCDKLRLNQIFLNILGNAVKFTAPGGLVSLRIVQKQVHEDGHVTYEFRIKDTGIGMSAEFLEHIFEPFTREQTSTASGLPGTGLGMSITKNIVDTLDGQIEVNSEPNKGTEFIVTLRFRLQRAPKQVEPIQKLDGVRGLVVDDDLNTCMSVSKMLRQIGMRSEWTMYGKEAVARTEEAIEIGDPFYVYIIDWLMADMNGIETARRIRRTVGEDAPIIILTAYDWADIEQEARDAGVTAFINKPLFLSDLHNVLLDACGESVKSEPLDIKEIAAGLEGTHILLAEDNEFNQEITVETLKEVGFVVEVAENGRQAVEMLLERGADYYKLILMDVQMPVMDGYEATGIIRSMEDADLAQIPIVAMTANAFETDRIEALEAGMNDHVAKPFRTIDLIEAIVKLLKK